MNRFLKIRLTLSAAVSAIALIGAAQAQQIGVNAAVKNSVTIRSENDAAARNAAVGGDVRLKDTIRSGEKSALQVLLLDETVFTVGAKAQLTVDRFIYDPDAGSGEMAASVARGAFRMMSGRTAKNPRNVSVTTPVASMGVRGTIVEGAVGADVLSELAGLENIYAGRTLSDDATLIVLRGPGPDNRGFNRDGEVEVVTKAGRVVLRKPNAAVLIPDIDGEIIGPFDLPESAGLNVASQLGTVPDGEPTSEVFPLDLPAIFELDEPPFEPRIDPDDEQITDRPTGDCPISDGIPVTDGGIILDGDPGQVFDDFGSPDFGVECLEGDIR